MQNDHKFADQQEGGHRFDRFGARVKVNKPMPLSLGTFTFQLTFCPVADVCYSSHLAPLCILVLYTYTMCIIVWVADVQSPEPEPELSCLPDRLE